MFKFVRTFLPLILIGICTQIFAQETSCTDGIDNDGDGLIDCADGECDITGVEEDCNCDDGIDYRRCWKTPSG